MHFGLTFGPAAPPRGDLVAALQQRMLVLGYTPSVGGVYSASEDAVVQSYADQLGLEQEDRFDLNGVIASVLPVMDADIEAASLWRGNSKSINANTVEITGRVTPTASGLGLGLLALLGVYLLTRK